MAKFVLNDPEGPVPPAAAAVPPLAPAPAPAQMRTGGTPAADPVEMDTDRPSESAPPSDRRSDKDGRDTVAIEDLNLPKSIITRLAKGVLPPNTQIQANAILAMTKGATVFISHLANAANERTAGANKKTIMPADVFAALEDIEFPEFQETLQAEFKKFNEIRTTKRNTYRRRVAAAKKGVPFTDPNASTASAALSDGATDADTSMASASGAQQPRSKKMKPNAPGEDSAMDLDNGDEEDADTDPDDDAQEEDEDDEEEEEDEDEEDEDDEENGEGDEMHDALEERENAKEDDEALDNGDDSDS